MINFKRQNNYFFKTQSLQKSVKKYKLLCNILQVCFFNILSIK